MRRPKPPRKKNPGDPNDPENTRGKTPGQQQAPAAAERTEPEMESGPRNPAPNISTDEGTAVTNHDEQEKITNADDSDRPVADK